MTETHSPSAWVAAIDCFGRYLGFFLIALVVSVAVGVLLAPQLGATLLLTLQLIAITVASVQATKAYDIKCAESGVRVSAMALGFRFWVVLAVPWIVLAFVIALVLPDTMAGGYVLVWFATVCGLARPICALVGAPVGVFLAR